MDRTGEDTEKIFNEVYENTYKELARYVMSRTLNTSDAMDILQHTYFQFYKKLLSEERSDVKNVKSYLFTIASNETGKTYRKRKKEDPISIYLDEEIDHMKVTEDMLNIELYSYIELPDKIAERRIIIKQIWNFIRNMDKATVSIFALRFFDGFVKREIAEKLGISESTVNNKLYRGIKKIRKQFKLWS